MNEFKLNLSQKQMFISFGHKHNARGAASSSSLSREDNEKSQTSSRLLFSIFFYRKRKLLESANLQSAELMSFERSIERKTPKAFMFTLFGAKGGEGFLPRTNAFLGHNRAWCTKIRRFLSGKFLRAGWVG